MTSGENLKRLLAAHRDGDHSAFHRVAEGIIADELAANHHALARDLRKALGEQPKPSKLHVLPTDKRHGSRLIELFESNVYPDQVVLSKRTERQVIRILEEHKCKSQLASFGYKPKRKILFWGPPGCGKTLTARLIAHELGLPIGVIRLSSLISSFLGDTANHLESIFELASSKPMVLLLDEVDAVGKSRDDRHDVGEVKRVVNSLLQLMDSFTAHEESILIAASNHQHILDAALWRRFDDVIEFPNPSVDEISNYLRKQLNGVSSQIAFPALSKKMSGLSFADIEKVVIEAAKSMILSGREIVTTQDIECELKELLKTLAARQEI